MPPSVALMVTCLVDLFYPHVGVAMIRLLRCHGAIHVAVFGPEALVPGLDEAAVVLEAWHAAGPAGANVVFITGPSRTADIELTLTRGVHGPKELHAVFVDAPEAG